MSTAADPIERCPLGVIVPCCLPLGHRGVCKYKCTSPTCPGLTYPASTLPHPSDCGVHKLELLPSELQRDGVEHGLLLIHPSENFAEVRRALEVNGFVVYQSGDHRVVVQRWRVSLALKQRERAALTPEQRAAEDAFDAAITRTNASGREP